MTRRIQRILFAAVCICLCSLLWDLPAAATQSEIDKVNKNLNQLEDQREDSKQELAGLQEEKAYLDGQQARLDGQLTALAQELTDLQERLAQTEASLAQTQQQLEAAREEEAKQYGNMKKRIRFLYEKGDFSFLATLLEAQSLVDMLNYGEYVESIYSYDREMLQQYQAVRDEIAAKEEQLEAETKEISALTQQQQEAVNQVETLLAQVQANLSSTSQEINKTKEELAAYEAEIEKQKAIEDELERKKAQEDAKRQEEIRRQQEEEERRQQEEKDKQNQNNGSGQTGAGSEGSQTGADSGSNQTGTGNDGSQTGQDTGSGQTGADSGGQDAPAESAGDLALLAALIECEAGGESYEGKLAVGSVVMNRVRSSRFPNSVVEVIYQKGQFSPVASGRFAAVLSRGASADSVRAAQECLAGNSTVNCLYFCRNNGLVTGLVIGNHVFY